MIRLAPYFIAFSIGVAAGAGVLKSCQSAPNETKVKISDKPIPKQLTKDDITIPNPSEVTIYDGLKRENDKLRRESQRLRAEYLEAIQANPAADSVVDVGGTGQSLGLASTLSEVCTRAVQARVGLSPLFQANAGINVLLAVFAREQQKIGFAEYRRFGLLPVDEATNNPIIEIKRSKTVIRWWDPMAAHWLEATYRHPVPRTHYVYAGAGTILKEAGMSYGPAAGIDLHAGRLRLSAEGVLDVTDPKNSAAMATAMVGF